MKGSTLQAVKSQRNRLCDRHRGRATTDVCWCSPESNDPRTTQPNPPPSSSNSIKPSASNSPQIKSKAWQGPKACPEGPQLPKPAVWAPFFGSVEVAVAITGCAHGFCAHPTQRPWTWRRPPNQTGIFSEFNITTAFRVSLCSLGEFKEIAPFCILKFQIEGRAQCKRNYRIFGWALFNLLITCILLWTFFWILLK